MPVPTALDLPDVTATEVTPPAKPATPQPRGHRKPVSASRPGPGIRLSRTSSDWI